MIQPVNQHGHLANDVYNTISNVPSSVGRDSGLQRGSDAARFHRENLADGNRIPGSSA
jgi:hypothetical protein